MIALALVAAAVVIPAAIAVAVLTLIASGVASLAEHEPLVGRAR